MDYVNFEIGRNYENGSFTTTRLRFYRCICGIIHIEY